MKGRIDGQKRAAAAAAVPGGPESADAENLYQDLVAGRLDREATEGEDETFAQAKNRMRADQRAAKIREGLKGKHASAVYRRIARRSRNLTDAEFRVLDTLLEFSTQLTNCFPRRRTLLQVLGGRPRKLGRLDAVRHSLARKGWIKRVELCEDDRVRHEGYEQLLAANDTGRFISATGYVFCIPAGEITPYDSAWTGPRTFTNRIFGQRWDTTSPSH
jgi:hypothetical protein